MPLVRWKRLLIGSNLNSPDLRPKRKSFSPTRGFGGVNFIESSLSRKQYYCSKISAYIRNMVRILWSADCMNNFHYHHLLSDFFFYSAPVWGTSRIQSSLENPRWPEFVVLLRVPDKLHEKYRYSKRAFRTLWNTLCRFLSQQDKL